MNFSHVIIVFKNGITIRKAREDDVAGNVRIGGKSGVLTFCKDEEAAKAAADDFWAGRGYRRGR